MKSLFQNLFKKGGHYLMSSAAITLLTAISVPLYTRLFPPIEMGYYYIVTSVASLVSIATGLGMENGLARYYYEYHQDPATFKRFLSSYLLFSALWGLGIWGLLMCVPTALWGRFLEPSYLRYLPIGLTLGLLLSYVAMVSTILRIGMASRALASVNFLNALFIFGGTLLLAKGFHLGILGRLLSQVVVSIGVVALLVARMYKKDLLTFALDGRFLREGFRFSLPLIPETSMSWISCLSDRLLLAIFKFSASVGTYAFGYDLARMIMALFSESTFQAYGPMFYKEMTENPKNFAEKHNRFCTHYVLLMAAITLGLTLFAYELIRILTPKSYASSSLIIPIIAYSSLLGAMYKPFVVALAYLKKTFVLSALSFVCAMSNLLMNFVLIPRYGSIGAAWSTFFAVFIYAALAYVYSQRGLPIAYEYGRLGKILGSNLLCLGLYLLVSMRHYPYPVLLAVKVGCFALFPVLLYGLRFFNDEEKYWTRKLTSLQGIRECVSLLRG